MCSSSHSDLEFNILSRKQTQETPLLLLTETPTAPLTTQCVSVFFLRAQSCESLVFEEMPDESCEANGTGRLIWIVQKKKSNRDESLDFQYAFESNWAFSTRRRCLCVNSELAMCAMCPNGHCTVLSKCKCPNSRKQIHNQRISSMLLSCSHTNRFTILCTLLCMTPKLA